MSVCVVCVGFHLELMASPSTGTLSFASLAQIISFIQIRVNSVWNSEEIVNTIVKAEFHQYTRTETKAANEQHTNTYT